MTGKMWQQDQRVRPKDYRGSLNMWFETSNYEMWSVQFPPHLKINPLKSNSTRKLSGEYVSADSIETCPFCGLQFSRKIHCRKGPTAKAGEGRAKEGASNHWIIQSSNQATNQSSKQSFNQAIKQPTNQANNHSIKQSSNQPIKQTINQSSNQATNQSSKQSINQSINQTNKQTNNSWRQALWNIGVLMKPSLQRRPPCLWVGAYQCGTRLGHGKLYRNLSAKVGAAEIGMGTIFYSYS